jgi:hypothetical protein
MMRRTCFALTAGAALLCAGAFAADGGTTTEAASPIIDRTFVCSVPARGTPVLEVWGQAGGHEIVDQASGRKQKAAAYANLRVVRVGFSEELVGVAASMGPGWGVSINREYCIPVRRRIPLSNHGLASYAAGPFGDEFECSVPKQILVRVPAVFRAPTVLLRAGVPHGNRSRRVLRAKELTIQASLAARTQAGKPIAFATAHESGKVRLFTAARNCIAD